MAILGSAIKVDAGDGSGPTGLLDLDARICHLEEIKEARACVSTMIRP